MGKDLKEVVSEVVSEELENNKEKTHIVKTEKVKIFKSGYVWSTQYNRNRFEEQRTVAVPEDTPVNILYAHQLLTQADLCHMVVFNAHNQGYMDRDEYLEILGSTKNVLKRVLPYLKEAKEFKVEQYEDMMSIYKRLLIELQEEGIIKQGKK